MKLLIVTAFISIGSMGCGKASAEPAQPAPQIDGPVCNTGSPGGSDTFGPFSKTDFASAAGDYLKSVSFSGTCSSENPTNAHFSTDYKVVVSQQEFVVTLKATDYPADESALDQVLSARRWNPKTADFQFAVDTLIPILQPLVGTTDPDTHEKTLRKAEQSLRDYFHSPR